MGTCYDSAGLLQAVPPGDHQGGDQPKRGKVRILLDGDVIAELNLLGEISKPLRQGSGVMALR